MLRLQIEAFVLSEASKEEVSAIMRYPSLSRSSLEVFLGGINAAVARFREAPSPPLIMIEVSDVEEGLFKSLDALADVCQPGTSLAMLGRQDSVSIYRSLTARGVADYIVLPADPQAIVGRIEDLFQETAGLPKARTIAIMGVKGGVGSSTIAHNIAWFLPEIFGQQVCLFDLDMRFGTTGLDFNQEARQGFRQVIQKGASLSSQDIEDHIMRHGERLSILMSPPGLSDYLGPTQEGLERTLDLLKTMVSFIVMDVPHRWEPWIGDVMTLSDAALLVADTDLPCLRNAQLVIEQVNKRRPIEAPIRYILNNVGEDKRSALSDKDFKEALGTEPLAEIPYRPALFRGASLNGQMIGEVDRRAAIARTFERLARLLAGRSAAGPATKAAAGGGLFGLFGGAKK